MQPNTVVHSVIYDEAKGKATGVRVIDAQTKKATEYFAKIIFINAACLNTNLILLNSTSKRFANGLGNDNGLLGKYVAFQNYRGKTKQAPGLDIHEVGGVRMGHDPKTSLLNKWNQLHTCKNVFVTDGACMTSTATQNPSLTFMALTARAADHAVSELKKGNL